MPTSGGLLAGEESPGSRKHGALINFRDPALAGIVRATETSPAVGGGETRADALSRYWRDGNPPGCNSEKMRYSRFRKHRVRS